MSSRSTRRKSGADDDVPDKEASEQEDGNQQRAVFQRPGPACSKRRTLEANTESQSALPFLRPRATSSMGSPSPVRQTVEDQAVSPSQNSQNESQSASAEEDPNSQPVLPPSVSGETSTSTSSPADVQDSVTNQLKQSPQSSPSGSKSCSEEELHYITLVRKFPILYNTNDRTTRGRLKKLESWRAISKEMGNSTATECKDRWRSIREKYCRAKKQLVDEGCVNEKTMEFINNLSFLNYQRRSGIKRKKPTITPGKRKQSKLTSHSDLKATPPEIQDGSPKPDQPFADDIAAALQRFSPEQKYVLKAKFWQVLAEFGSRP